MLNTRAHRLSVLWLLAAAALVLLTTGSFLPLYGTPTNETCLECHGDKSLTGTDSTGKEINMSVDVDTFKVSSHGSMACVDCHTDLANATDFPHADKLKPVECGSCHVAFAPRLLPASSWRIIMRDLDRHFGVDASVDRDTAASIGAFLEANAGRDGGKRVDASALRITEARWFRHEHAGIAATTWARSDVGSAANCGACHRDAGRGDFNERAVRVPR